VFPDLNYRIFYIVILVFLTEILIVWLPCYVTSTVILKNPTHYPLPIWYRIQEFITAF
jgi:hypothetical protein